MDREAATLEVRSSLFTGGSTIPDEAVLDRMGCRGRNQSPNLTWSGAPAQTKSYAVTVWDSDAPTGVGFAHWVLFDIPADVTSLPSGAGSHGDAGVGAKHGTSDFGLDRYGGPCPPPGDPPHHYHFVVYALAVDKLAQLDHTTSYAKFKFMSRQHVVATGELVGLYGR